MRALIVIPCFNEATRLDRVMVDALLADPRVDILFVDDGSTDATLEVLDAIAASAPERVTVHALSRNHGKAEAVRAGLHVGVGRWPIIGFADADFATPPGELLRLLDALVESDAELVLGSRVLRLGAAIDRSPVRHVIGRVFATVAAMAVGAPVYDTQCGAKWFRVTPAFIAAIAEPFTSRWSFDVELLGRLFGRLPAAVHTTHEAALEVPLHAWRDVSGSKLNLTSMARSFAELVGIWARTKRR